MKIKILLVFLLFTFSVNAQNVQALYETSKDREYLTTTIEGLHTDKLGSTFYFVDMEFNDNHHASLAYMEISRSFKIKKTPISFHLEYNGGLFQNTEYSYRINNSYLAGMEYSWLSKDFSKFLNLQVLHKNIIGIDKNTFQLTGVWDINILKGQLTFSGFVDLWKENNAYIFISEPQVWYNLNNNFSIGGEVEVSNNLLDKSGLQYKPAIGVKYKL